MSIEIIPRVVEALHSREASLRASRECNASTTRGIISILIVLVGRSYIIFLPCFHAKILIERSSGHFVFVLKSFCKNFRRSSSARVGMYKIDVLFLASEYYHANYSTSTVLCIELILYPSTKVWFPSPAHGVVGRVSHLKYHGLKAVGSDPATAVGAMQKISKFFLLIED